MHASLRTLAAATLILAASGCAGGWRNGPPPGESAVPAGTAPPTATAYAEVPARSSATADGALFVYKGEGGSVALAGEFNSWNVGADPMSRQPDGAWVLKKPLEPGRYQYKFVIDGTTWKEDPGAAESVDDGYGGKNSVIVVGSGGAAPAPAASAAARTVAGATTADGTRFTYQGAGGSVALAGEFNSWSTSADPLTRQADGSWVLVKKLEPGRYQYKFVIDGSTWKEDPAASGSTDDGYGGKNSVVVVGGAATSSGATPAASAAPAAAGTAATGTAKPPRVTADGVEFTFAGSATSVALAGDFNQWSPTVDLMKRQADGAWTLVKKLAPGTYAYKFVVNGTTWKQDEANPNSTDDGFGGKNSVLTVP